MDVKEQSSTPPSGSDPKQIWRSPEVLAAIVAAFIVALFSAGAQYLTTSIQINAARTESSEQYRQVLAQLERQHAFDLQLQAQQSQESERLQTQQHTLSLKQIEVQDKFARDLLRMQLEATEKAELRRRADSKVQECLASQERSQQLRTLTLSQLISAVNAMRTADAEYITSVDVGIGVLALGIFGQSYQLDLLEQPENQLTWEVAKDRRKFAQEASIRAAASHSTLAELSTVLASARAVFPEAKDAFDAVAKKVPPQTKFSETNAQLMKLLAQTENQAWDVAMYRLYMDTFKISAVRIDTRAQFLEEVTTLRERISEQLVRKPASCL